MEIEPKHVFLDTEAYRAKQFNFATPALQQLVTLANDGSIALYSTTLTDREVDAQIHSMVEATREAVNTFKHAACILRNVPELRPVFEKLQYEVIPGIRNSNSGSSPPQRKQQQSRSNPYRQRPCWIATSTGKPRSATRKKQSSLTPLSSKPSKHGARRTRKHSMSSAPTTTSNKPAQPLHYACWRGGAGRPLRAR